MPDGVTVARLVLVQEIGVRFPVRQQIEASTHWVGVSVFCEESNRKGGGETLVSPCRNERSGLKTEGFEGGSIRIEPT